MWSRGDAVTGRGSADLMTWKRDEWEGGNRSLEHGFFCEDRFLRFPECREVRLAQWLSSLSSPEWIADGNRGGHFCTN